MRGDPGEAGTDDAEQFPLSMVGNQGVVDLKQHLETVALFLQLVMAEGVIHGHGHLGGDAFHEAKLFRFEGVAVDEPEAYGAEPPARGGQGQKAAGADLIGADYVEDSRPAPLGFEFRNQ